MCNQHSAINNPTNDKWHLAIRKEQQPPIATPGPTMCNQHSTIDYRQLTTDNWHPKIRKQQQPRIVTPNNVQSALDNRQPNKWQLIPDNQEATTTTDDTPHCAISTRQPTTNHWQLTPDNQEAKTTTDYRTPNNVQSALDNRQPNNWQGTPDNQEATTTTDSDTQQCAISTRQPPTNK